MQVSLDLKLPQPWIPAVTQPVTDEVERKHRQEYRHSGEEGNPPRGSEVVAPIRYHGTPGRRWRRYARAQEAENSLREDYAAHLKRCCNNDSIRHARQDMAVHYARRGRASNLGKRHIVETLQLKCLPTYQAHNHLSERGSNAPKGKHLPISSDIDRQCDYLQHYEAAQSQIILGQKAYDAAYFPNTSSDLAAPPYARTTRGRAGRPSVRGGMPSPASCPAARQ